MHILDFVVKAILEVYQCDQRKKRNGKKAKTGKKKRIGRTMGKKKGKKGKRKEKSEK